MRLSSGSVSSSLKTSGNRSGSRIKKKHKRLDAICEKEYSRNHGDVNEDGRRLGTGTADADFGLRRSNRVRRAPVLLDASPSTRKKRRRLHEIGTVGVNESGDEVPAQSEDSNDESQGNWTSRLRSRNRNLGIGVVKRTCVSRKRKLFEEINEVKTEKSLAQVDERNGNLVGWKPLVNNSSKVRGVRTKKNSKRSKEVKKSLKKDDHGREQMLVISIGDEEEQEEREIVEEKEEIEMVEEQEDSEEAEKHEEDDKEVGAVEKNALHLEVATGDENVIVSKVVNDKFPQIVAIVEEETSSSLHVDKAFIGDQNEEPTNEIENANNVEIQVEKLTHVKEGGSQIFDAEAGGVSANDVVGRKSCTEKDVELGELAEKPVQHDVNFSLKKFTNGSTSKLGKAPTKEGRRCGLCGGGTDGKPPKKVVQDLGESEAEACSGSSASEEPNYDMWDGFGDEPGWLGRLLGPINDRYGIAGIWVHQHCAVWSPEVYFAGLGCLKNVRAALCRGRALKCTRCGRPGATIGCRVDRCPKTYHLPCARANGCIFDHRKFLIACTDHRHFFQPHGNQYLARIKRLKAKKVKLELRKLSNDAWRRDIEAEEKWLENCGEDEEFLKRESKRLHRDLVRIAPAYIGGSNPEGEKLFQGWESVAGLQGVIQCMKEVVFLPLLYPEFFDRLGIAPPRGVLLHGYPGTGKTHVVRALIGSCARGDKRIAYFARKGADCLGKYVGDAERQLRLLFQVAEKCQPSIIFFDEIDGLAPCRTRQQDQTHNSVVSTLLALLDGLKSRGSVVVIGATNRPDAVDPALRRPGRFDREIYFPLPSVEDRAAILSLHTQKWPKPVGGPLLQWVARRTAGFAGADLQALCTQVAINALKRNFPLKEVLSTSGEQAIEDIRPPLPAIAVVERDWLEALQYSPPPCSRREAGMAANDVATSPLPFHLIPCLLQPLSTLLVSLYLDERIYLPARLFKAATVIKNVIISALNVKKLVSSSWWSYVYDFVQEADIANEIGRKLQGSGLLLGDTPLGFSDGFDDETGDGNSKCIDFVDHHGGAPTIMVERRSFELGNQSGFRILIAGNPRSGPRHLASCLLHCYIEHVEIRKVDMATISLEGHGDLVLGISRILVNCSSMGSCIIFMPRIDLWAVEAHNQTFTENGYASDQSKDGNSVKHDQYPKDGNSVKRDHPSDKENGYASDQSNSTQMSDLQVAAQCTSQAWSLFVEQVGSLSPPLMIMATSEVPFLLLPQEIRQFFMNDLSICNCSTAFQHKVPQFSVQIDGVFNQDTVIDQSAAELSRDIVKLLVHLIHQKTHSNPCPSRKSKPLINQSDTTDHQVDERTSRVHIGVTSPDESSVRVSPLPNSRITKVKSNLMSAVSTFGYQILRYPHFAELCWVTSKLKEGPSADVRGPWKGWPFNSCIIRPMSSLDKVGSSSLNNAKSKEISGLVRGLVAVGLSAIRGCYTSLRRVSFDVRVVLDLLVEQINVKIDAGKDRYQYVRLLSQVAYLEDVVNNWAFTLQSLEQDPQKMEMSIRHTSEENNRTVSTESSHMREIADCSVQEPIAEKVVCINSTVDGDVIHSTDRTSEPTGQQEMDFPLNNSVSHESYRNANGGATVVASSADDQVVDNVVLSKHNETLLGPNDLRNLKCTVVDGKFEKDKHLNLRMESLVDLESHHRNSNGICADEFLSNRKLTSNGCSSLETSCEHQDRKVETDECNAKTQNGLSTHSEILCSIHCCAICFNVLYGVIKMFLHKKIGLNCNKWTVEDVHDVIAALSVDLLTAVKREILERNDSDTFEDRSREVNSNKFIHSDTKICQCRSSSSRSRSRDMLVTPLECICHSENESLSWKVNEVPYSQLSFIFRDGVLVNVDPKKNVSFHCKLETLCLCSLTELMILTANKPFQ